MRFPLDVHRVASDTDTETKPSAIMERSSFPQGLVLAGMSCTHASFSGSGLWAPSDQTPGMQTAGNIAPCQDRQRTSQELGPHEETDAHTYTQQGESRKGGAG